MQNEQAFQANERTSPHFDEEWTVLAAQPVVPLQELKAKTNRRAGLKLVGAFAAALILGALAALVAVGIKQPTHLASQASQVGQDDGPVTDGVVIQPQAAPLETAEQVELLQPDPDIAESEPSSEPKHEEAMAVKVNSPTRHYEKHRSNEAANNEKPLEVQIQVEPRQNGIDRFEERRLRRVLRRQRRERANQQRDLGRINEIFEGRRPRP
jgi:hypothetical protein